jgi:acetyl-CoA acyltransferase
MSKEAYIVSSVRTAVAKAKKGAFRQTRPEMIGAAAVRGALSKAGKIDESTLDDVLMGCAMPEGEQGLNMARVISLRAGLPNAVSAATINRFCSSGLQTIAMATQAIIAGHAESVIAGGVESMTLVPMSGFHFAPDPYMVEHRPEIYIGMGITAENVANKYGISRQDQDEFAYHSHRKAIEAIKTGKFKDEIIPMEVFANSYTEDGVKGGAFVFDTDEGPRADTSIEALSGLRPAFNPRGTVTAGNASQMSDGAAASFVVSGEYLKEHNLKPIARLVGFATAGVAPEIMGIGPIESIPKVLKQTGLKLEDIGLTELNEAFASQSLAIIRELGMNPDTVNVNGGAIALGHPLGCTGAKLTATLLHEMMRRNVRYGMCTMCIGGGMGASGIFENLTL